MEMVLGCCGRFRADVDVQHMALARSCLSKLFSSFVTELCFYCCALQLGIFCQKIPAFLAAVILATELGSFRLPVIFSPPPIKKLTHTHTHPFYGPLNFVQDYLGEPVSANLDFTEARDSGWKWHQLGYMQICTSPQTDNHATAPPLSFYRLDALPVAQPTASKH